MMECSIALRYYLGFTLFCVSLRIEGMEGMEVCVYWVYNGGEGRERVKPWEDLEMYKSKWDLPLAVRDIFNMISYADMKNQDNTFPRLLLMNSVKL